MVKRRPYSVGSSKLWLPGNRSGGYHVTHCVAIETTRHRKPCHNSTDVPVKCDIPVHKLFKDYFVGCFDHIAAFKVSYH